MTKRLQWGIIGTGAIARTFARGLAVSAHGTLVAVGSRTQAAAESFGDALGAPYRYGTYDALLADPRVEAVYIATPHPMHAQWAVRAAEAGKHILCEKPLTLNHAEAMAVTEAARAHHIFLMEAFMYRCHPQTAALIELIRSGAIGDVRLIQASFGFTTTPDPTRRLFNHALGGGGILDVGCYPVSMARLIAGVATGQAFADPLEVKGTAQIGAVSRVDEYAVAVARFPGGILAELATGVQVRAGECRPRLRFCGASPHRQSVGAEP